MNFVPIIGEEDQKVYALLTTDELDFNKDKRYTPLLTFPVYTYDKLSTAKDQNKPSEWPYVFQFVNQFFDTLSPDDKTIVAKAFALIKHKINQFQLQNNIYMIQNLTKEISAVLVDMDMTTDFCTKLYAFVVEKVPIGIMKNAGKRPQDRPELTFTEDDVKIVNTITVLCKVLCPIFGTLITVTKSQIDSRIKEVHCASIMAGIIWNRYAAVSEKLKYYIEHVTHQLIKKEEEDILVYGHDMASLAYQFYCQLLVRQLVNVDLSVSDSNLMSYIIVSVKRAIINTQGTINGSPTKPRKPPEAESDDEGNIAQLETDSMTSKKPNYIPDLIIAAVPSVIARYKSMFNITDAEYQECLNYYNGHPFIPNILNRQLNSLLYGQDFGGSDGINILKAPDFNRITVLTQMIIAQYDKDPAFKTLAHLMTAVPSIATTVRNDELNSNLVWMQVSATQSYKNCRQRFVNSTVATKNKEWRPHIESILQDMTESHYAYNTADLLWDFFGDENKNGILIHLNKDALIAYCSFYDWYMTVKEEARAAGGL